MLIQSTARWGIALYRLLRPLLFRLDPETSHTIVFFVLRLLYWFGIGWLVRLIYTRRTASLPITLMGLNFRNPVGLAAGLDKDAHYIKPLADFGFGALELGTVTPRAQPGNPKKRLFRLPRQHALINRMGFNNAGIDAFINRLRRVSKGKTCVIGVNIGKNHDTAIERAVDDYLRALRAVYTYADYVAVNISSPNTPGLRALQDQDRLGQLLRALKAEQIRLAKTRRVYIPIALKLAPDLGDEQITGIARQVREVGLDAVIATNTSLSRPGLDDELLAQETGGLSGRPLKELSTGVIRTLYARLQGEIPIIGVGGIESAQDAWDKLVAGADFVQVYTGLIYRGPALVREITQGLAQRVRAANCATLKEAVERTRAGVS